MPDGWTPILPYAVLAAGILLVFSLAAWTRGRPGGALLIVSLAASLGAAAAAFCITPRPEAFAQTLDAGAFARFYQILLCGLTFAALLFTGGYARKRGFERDELYALMLLAALGMCLFAAALDWVMLFLGLEMLSISLYVIIAAHRDAAHSAEAALKYFVLGAVASAFLLFGIALLYAATGETSIAASLRGASLRGMEGTALLGLAFILVGLGFKISLAPFHLWTPDVYQGAPAPVTAFLSTGSKVAVFAGLLRLALAGSEIWGALSPILWILSALTMAAATLGALTQPSVKRMLAYSSAGHMGYLLMALPAAPVFGPVPIMFYSAVYALMDLGAFGGLGLLSPLERDMDDLEDLKGLGFSRPYAAGGLGLCLLTLAGLPPTAGFTGKFMLFEATLAAGYVGLAVIGILAAVVSVYYYLRVLAAMYMRPAAAPTIHEGTRSGDLALALVCALILVFGLLPAPVLDALAGAAPLLP